MTDLAPPAPAAPEPVAAPVADAAPAPAPSSAPEPKAEAPSRREAISRALAKVSGEEVPAKAEEPKGDGPARGPDGRFVGQQAAGPATDLSGAAQQAAVSPPIDGQQQAANPEAKPSLSEPPARFSADAKAAWTALPDAVKGEVHRAIREMEKGLQEKDARLAPLKPFFDLAQRTGTTLPEAMSRYVAMEQALRQDPIRGMDAIARNMGLSLEAIARRVLGQPQDRQQAAKDQRIAHLERQIAAMSQQVGTVTQTIQQQRQQSAQDTVAAFFQANPHAEDLRYDIGRLIQSGEAASLEDAYAKALDRAKSLAARLIPAPPPAPAPQPRPALSVTGAPSAGSNPARPAPSKSPREAISRALRATGL